MMVKGRMGKLGGRDSPMILVLSVLISPLGLGRPGFMLVHCGKLSSMISLELEFSR